MSTEELKNKLAALSHSELIDLVLLHKKQIAELKDQNLTVDDMLVKCLGNQSEVARVVNCNRGSLRGYITKKIPNRVITLENGEKQILVPPRA